MKAATERPIFIIGVHRSGTTLLRYMLNSSPRIYIPPESDFIPRFFGRDPVGELSEPRIAAILTTIFAKYRLVKEWQGDPPAIEAFLQAMPARTPAAFLDTLYGTYARQHGAVRWGDKTPIYASYVGLIDQIFPQAQFIHVIRDGRDVALSMLDKWRHEIHIDIYFAARNWVRRIHQARGSGAQLGAERYYELRYEALVEDPEAQLRPLCEFLGEPYLPEMAKPHRLGRERIQPGDFHSAIRQPPSTARVGRWQSEMSEADQRLFQRIAGPLLLALGYAMVGLGPMPIRETLRYAGMGTKYGILQAGRRLLQAAGLMPPI
jgi:hypothetical protein